MKQRDEYVRWRHFRMVAGEQRLRPERVVGLIQGFIDRYKNIRLQRKGTAFPGAVAHPQGEAIGKAIVGLGLAWRRAGVRGLAYHQMLQRAIAELGPTFGYRGFCECFASYDTREKPGHAGRMDVVWAAERTPSVLFEIDSTVKAISLQKLLLTEAPHKFWVYFGGDVWDFKISLWKWDPRGEVGAIIVPRCFVPCGERVVEVGGGEVEVGRGKGAEG